uniref:Uncharacterized protein n=1 Tax=Panagrolaimus sp. PS1159 TaxID=55785 RepID=A0AC35FNV4_9BILA
MIRRIQQENVNKKQTVLKLISILRENPEILDKAEKAGNPEPGFSCIQAAQSTPGTSKEYDEISKHLESIKARRGRMNAIRERLSQVSAAQTMDDTYQSALKRLEALSTIRKTLEESASETPEEETEPKTESNQKEENKPTAKFPLETKPPLTSTTSVQLVTDSDGDEEEEEEEDEAVREVDKLLLDEVRKEFLSRFENPSSHFPSLLPPTIISSPSQPYQNILTQCNCNCPEMAIQLERIEEQLALQNHRLTALHDQV